MFSRDDIFVFNQYFTPQHFVSRSAGKLAECEIPSIRDPFIKWFASHYKVNMQEAERESLSEYKHFNDFFTRALKDGARPIDQEETAIVSPVDGAVSQLGKIEHDKIFQAKGHSYSVKDLLGGSAERAEPFIGGEFATIYLSPKDYHRIHMPVAGTLREMVYVPGKLFSVNPATTSKVPRLFARNERVVAIFDTELGPMAMVLVGAMIVASIETVWAGLVAPVRRSIKATQYDPSVKKIHLEKGAEMGRFKLGSTVVMAFPKGVSAFNEELGESSTVRMGEKIATRL